jgi:hypothetical protein
MVVDKLRSVLFVWERMCGLDVRRIQLQQGGRELGSEGAGEDGRGRRQFAWRLRGLLGGWSRNWDWDGRTGQKSNVQIHT